MKPPWLVEVELAARCRAAGVILTFNTADRVHLAADGLEVASLRYALAHYFALQGYHIAYYATGRGFTRLVPPSVRARQNGTSPIADVPDSSDPGLVLTALGRLLRRAEPPVLVILDYADHLAPHAAGMTAMLRTEQMRTLEILHDWSLDDDIKAPRTFVILGTHENAASSLLTQAGGYRVVRVNLPPEQERRAFVEYLISVREGGCRELLGELAPGFALQEFARTTGGLRLLDIEELLRRSAASGVPVDRTGVRQLKQRAIAQLGRDLVEVIEPERGFDSVAGCGHAKEYFELIRRPWLAGASSVPQAILLAGVPGCGKSHLVKALARELEVPLLVMRNVREAWVGASERNLETVLWIAENLSPCVLWTDEVDQAVGQRGTGASGDSGTSERILGRIFEFFGSMQHRGRVLWVATTNRPDILDPALLDRFQVIIPFVHPTESERVALLPLLAGQVGRGLAEDIDPREIAALRELSALTVRSLQEILVLAGLRADRGNGAVGSPIRREHMLRAVADYKPNYDLLEHEFVALTALQMTTFTSLLPWMGEAGLRGDAEWPCYLEGLVDPETGALRTRELAERLTQVKRARRLDRNLR